MSAKSIRRKLRIQNTEANLANIMKVLELVCERLELLENKSLPPEVATKPAEVEK